MKRRIVFAGGCRKWIGFCPDYSGAIAASRNALECCVKNSIKEVVVTGWGDNGAEASVYTLLPGLTLYAEKCYTNNMSDSAISDKLYTLFGYTLDEFMYLQKPNQMPGNSKDIGVTGTGSSKSVLWNDPIVGIYDRHIVSGTGNYFGNLSDQLMQLKDRKNRLSYVFETIYYLCRCLEVKSEIGNRMRTAYNQNDEKTMGDVLKTTYEALARLEVFYKIFSENWRKENKVFGFEIQDIRFGTLMIRLKYVISTLEHYLNGETDIIPELEEPSLFLDCRIDSNDKPLNLSINPWDKLVTVNTL